MFEIYSWCSVDYNSRGHNFMFYKQRDVNLFEWTAWKFHIKLDIFKIHIKAVKLIGKFC